jgi:hypothetical protein
MQWGEKWTRSIWDPNPGKIAPRLSEARDKFLTRRAENGTHRYGKEHPATFSSPRLPSLLLGSQRGLDRLFESGRQGLPNWDCAAEARFKRGEGAEDGTSGIIAIDRAFRVTWTERIALTR